MNKELFKEYRRDTGAGVFQSDYSDELEWLEKKLLEAREQVENLNIDDVINTLTYDELKLIIKESCDIEDVRKQIDHRLG
tara:strand:- start:17 stop:256 length:240 start_codon:yes stop_codon:yes gene_type:complete